MEDVQVSSLVGSALNWAVFCAIYKGMQPTINVTEAGSHKMPRAMKPLQFPRHVSLSYTGAYGVECRWNPQGDWDECGPLIGRFNIDFTVERKDLIYASVCDDSGIPVMPGEVHGAFGPTHLIAACRAIVASHLGEVVSVPAELVENK
ncbi:MAG: DUF2591 domain-containing protein [Gammaproteobacteria bacterium]|uniref:DUF2591 domain-containing protein n=1 Tax=viral metagenome TaxID=1070528 RepID=A0A6M3MD27_9ZZZZ|nr:DUF2591 domain-containing protein [Gammaproteobacteria bacterium]